jgi:carbamoyltransferase
MIQEIARLLNEQNVIGFFQGKMEFGPRALGARSIIADPRSTEMQSKLNLKIKFRESFRPFAPSILEEKVDQYFDFDHPSPYMLLVYDVHDQKKAKISANEKAKKGLEKLTIKRSEIPAITHVDFSARVHTVSKAKNEYFYDVINTFYQLTGCPVIINTSFNVRGEPIVNTPEDAYQCFMRTNMDYLILENFLIEKKKQDIINVDQDWMKEFTLD